MYGKDGSMRKPMQKLSEYVEEGSYEDGGRLVNVYVLVAEEYISNEWGHPIMSDWRMMSDVHNKYHEALMREMKRREDADEVDKLAVSGSSVDGEDRASSAAASFVQIGDFSNIANIESTFELDWNLFMWTCVPVPVSEMQEASIRLAIRDNYNLVCNLFSHFCGIGKIGEKFGMTRCELKNLLYTSGIDEKGSLIERALLLLPDLKSPSMKDPGDNKSFNEDSSSSSTSTSSSASSAMVDNPLITRPQFAQVLVSVAFFSANTHVGLAETLQDAVFLPLGLYYSRLYGCYTLYANSDPSVRSTLHTFFYDIRRIFAHQGDVIGSNGPTMTLESFFRIMTRYAYCTLTVEYEKNI